MQVYICPIKLNNTALLSFFKIFKASALRPMLSISRDVRVCVCLSVRHTFSLRLTVFLPPLSEVQCLNLLDIRNPWGKVMERSGLRFEHFCSKMV